MSFIDWIKQLITNDKREITKIMGKDITKTIGATDKYCCAVYTQNKTLLKGVPVKLVVNGVEYSRATDDTGVACLNIGLGVGEYTLTATYEGDEQYTDATTTNLIKVAPVLTATDLSMSYHDGSSYKVTAKDSTGNPLANIPIILTVNGVSYKRITDTNGVASLTINLQAGTYPIKSECYGATINNTIKIAKATTRMEGTDINKTTSQTSTYQCAVYTPQNNRLTGTVDITVNGKTYTKTIDNEGLAKLNINLGVGEYPITSEYKGDNNYTSSKVTNKIKVTADPTPTPTNCKNPYTSSPFHTTQAPGQLGQRTSTSCGPHSLMQCYYNLTNIDASETSLISACGCTSAGTSHQGLATGLAWLNKKYGTNVTMEWKDFNDLGWKKLGELLCDPNTTIFTHLLLKMKWGHYSVFNKLNTSSESLNILYSLGSRCGTGYYGYQTSRSFSTQKQYMSGISQASICILRKH